LTNLVGFGFSSDILKVDQLGYVWVPEHTMAARHPEMVEPESLGQRTQIREADIAEGSTNKPL